MSEAQSNADKVDTLFQEHAIISATKAVSRPQHVITISNPPWSAMDDLMGDEEEVFEEALIPPENFNMVSDYIYRSSFPKKKHFSFLKKLGLKSVLLVLYDQWLFLYTCANEPLSIIGP
jgi:Tyrosine phosphatase family